AVEKALVEQGINLVKGATFERVEQAGEIKKVHVTVDGKKKVIESEQLLVATGRKPNTDKLNLHVAGVEVGHRKEIKINDYAQTSNEKIYANRKSTRLNSIPTRRSSDLTFERGEQAGEIKKVHVTVDGKKKVIESEQLLVATGRKPNTDKLNLHVAGVEVGPRKEIKINDYAQTSNEKIY